MIFPYTLRMHNSDPSVAAAVSDPVICVEGLAKEYRVFDKPEGLAASVRALFQRRRGCEEHCEHRGADWLDAGRELPTLLGAHRHGWNHYGRS